MDLARLDRDRIDISPDAKNIRPRLPERALGSVTASRRQTFAHELRD